MWWGLWLRCEEGWGCGGSEMGLGWLWVGLSICMSIIWEGDVLAVRGDGTAMDANL